MSATTQSEVTVHREYDWTETPPSVAVVEALADIKNVAADTPAAERRIEIADHVDPDALDRVLERGGAEVSFDLKRYRVHVDGEELTVSLR